MYNEEINSNQINKFIARTFGWMSIALLVTFLTSISIAMTEPLMNFLTSSPMLFYGILIGELAFVFYLASTIENMSGQTALMNLIFYAFINGITFSVIFLAYSPFALLKAFLIVCVLFGTMGLIGRFTKVDLTSLGFYLITGLIGVILVSIINMFFQSALVDYIVTIVGLVIFLGLTAYDVQKLKAFAMINDSDSKKWEVIGALHLYLDFINLFLKILRLGKK